jgi:hypothetical protein
MSEVIKFFRTTSDTLTAMRGEWTKLSDTDKAQLRTGIADGTLSY